MSDLVSRTAFAIALALGVARPAGAAARPSDKEVAAQVVEAAGLREGDLVLVEGDARDLDLLEEISLQVVRRGAARIQLVTRERNGNRYYSEVPEKYDAGRAAFRLKLAEVATAQISVVGVELPDQYRNVPPTRLSAVNKAFLPVGVQMLARNVRQVLVGNGLYPSEASARQLGLTRAELSAIFWSALADDPKATQANGSAVRTALAGKKRVRVTHPNGTDLTFGIEGRPVILSDGVITPERAAQGGASAIVYLPAGEAQVAPVAGTAEGTVVFDRIPFGVIGLPIEKLRWTFKGGRLVGHDARPGKGYDHWKQLYEAAGAGKDAFAGIDLGLHPGVKAPAGKQLLNWIPAGMVSLILGDDTSLGGTNSSDFYDFGFLPGATVEADGQAIVEKGVLKAAAR